jgi:hypothetical protein
MAKVLAREKSLLLSLHVKPDQDDRIAFRRQDEVGLVVQCSVRLGGASGWVGPQVNTRCSGHSSCTDNNIGNSSGVSASVHAQARPRRCDHANRSAAMISGVGQACGLAASLTLASPGQRVLFLDPPCITRGRAIPPGTVYVCVVTNALGLLWPRQPHCPWLFCSVLPAK